MNHYAKLCKSTKEKFHLAEDVEGYDSKELFLKIEKVTTIKGRGKQLMSSITFRVEGKYTEQCTCQLDTGATCNVISYKDLRNVLQYGNLPMYKCNFQLKLFDGTLMQTVGEITLTVDRRGKRHELSFQVVKRSN